MQHFIPKDLADIISFNIVSSGSIKFKIIVNDQKISIYHVLDEIMSMPFPCKIIKKFKELWFYDSINNSRIIIKYHNKYLYIGSRIIKYYINEQITEFSCLEEKQNIKSFLFGNKSVYYLNGKISMKKKYFITDPEPNNLETILTEFQKKSPYQKKRHIEQIDFYNIF